jgi:hypothetical protein
MFRFCNARATPQAAFSMGARSACYMGQWISRRHCSRAHTAFVGGFIDPIVAAGDCAVRGQLPVSGAMSVSDLCQLVAIGNSTIDLTNLVCGEINGAPLECLSMSGHYALLTTFGRVAVTLRSILVASPAAL